MRTLVVLTFLVSSLEFLFCTPVYPVGPNEEVLKQLSREGERHVDEEMKRALFGVKQMKETMERKEEKHKQFMNSLQHSSDKRKGAVQLATETEHKLQEAEQQCRDSLRMSFEECRPCLEDTCRNFYTSTCRRGFSSFSFKVEEFFKKMSAQLETQDEVYNQNQDPDQSQKPESQTQTPDGMEQELVQVDASFRQLKSRVGVLYNTSVELVNRMHQEFGHTFHVAFTTDLKPRLLTPTEETPSLGFLRGMGLEHILDSVYDFGKTMLEEFSYAMTDTLDEVKETQQQRAPGSSFDGDAGHSRYLCRRLRRQASDCWLLQDQCDNCQEALRRECPSMRELHSELEEIHLLLNASLQQYEDTLLVVQRHTDDTLTWLDVTAEKYGWVTLLANDTLGPPHIFSITSVVPHIKMRESGSKVDTTVAVKVLDSPLLTLSVPAELEMQDPAFIQYVAKEALVLYKQKLNKLQ
ncbi:clusterin-like protein 1 [Hypomesus transpacificus]|uniref:clusterin-like protein 1 n=1 Tax=Hypomesus transpacificus TaxID=137520 RepID=UPI001F07B12F|nr:clusterin-like protein 1 [Hypomesus transpacificus]